MKILDIPERVVPGPRVEYKFMCAQCHKTLEVTSDEGLQKAQEFASTYYGWWWHGDTSLGLCGSICVDEWAHEHPTPR